MYLLKAFITKNFVKKAKTEKPLFSDSKNTFIIQHKS